MLARFGIERAWLPAIARSDAQYGDLALEGGHRIPMRLLSGDQSTAAFAHGELRPEAAYLNVGTGAFVFRASNAPAPGKLLRSVVHWSDAGPEYVVEGTVNGAGSALAAFAREHGIADVTGVLDAAWRDDTSAADTVYLNGVGGLGSPDWRSDFPSQFLGAGTREQQLVAVAESIVFLIERNLAELRELDGPRCEYILASGGISQSDRFCQALADLIGLPVRRPAHCEATARGAAFLLAGRPKDWEALPETRFVAGDAPALMARHRRWREEMAAGGSGGSG
jgi:glycerol kinase